MTTLEQVIATVQTLPPADRQQLQLFLQAGLQEPARRDEAAAPPLAAPPVNGAHQSAMVEPQLARYRRAKQWISEHRAEYLNQWVVLDGDHLISHGTDGEQVYDQAKAAGINVPFLVWLNEEPAAFMTGLL